MMKETQIQKYQEVPMARVNLATKKTEEGNDGSLESFVDNYIEEGTPATKNCVNFTTNNTKKGNYEKIEPCGTRPSSLLCTDDSDSSYENKEYKEQYIGESREYWRDVILGINDGLVSTFLLVTGVGSSGLPADAVLMIAISGMIAGAISMAAGEYVATKTQEEVIKAQVDLEKKNIKERKVDALHFLGDLLTQIGIPEAETPEEDAYTVRQTLINYCQKNDDAHLNINVALAFGSVESSGRSPFIAGFVAFWLFTLGSLTSVLPFVFIKDTYHGIIVSFAATMFFVFAVGILKTWATGGIWWISASENFIITVGGGAVAYGIGKLFEGLVED